MKRRKLLNPETQPALGPRPCDVAGCDAPADFRAPHSRDRMSESRWFCLEHARAYNAAWDFFAGMSQTDIEHYQKESVTGHRPTWPFGLGPLGVASMKEMLDEHLRDALHPFTGPGARTRTRPPPEPKIPPEQRSALAKLNLEPGSTMKEIKARYKELVKRYHPDLNGGDRGGEAQLKDVNEAYRTLVRARSA